MVIGNVSAKLTIILMANLTANAIGNVTDFQMALR